MKKWAAVGASELLMPAVVPAELWKESGRWDYYGGELLRIKDRKNNDFCIGPTHEEVIVDVARHAAKSYRDLPICLYQIQSKFRDETRPRYGLMRGREFIMKDAYSFHLNEESLDEMYWKMHTAYTNIFKRCGLEFRPVEADSGAIGGDITHEFHVLADSGEDTIASCEKCDYAANIERAENGDELVRGHVPDDALAVEEVETPGKKSIEDVAEFMGVKPESTVKMLIYKIIINEDESFLIAVNIRGDREVNEAKLKNLYQASVVEIPSEEEALDAGLAVGYLGAHNFKNDQIKEVLADQSVVFMADSVCGANKIDYHLKNIYPSRDLTFDRVADLGFVSEGETCPRCKEGKLKMFKGIEVGQVFKLGKKYTESMKMTVLSENGRPEHPTMGCYGIGVGRTAAAAIEQNHDKDGIIWPTEIAPYQVMVINLDAGKEEPDALSKEIHDAIEKEGYDVLVDDRKERPGIKFKDCDLLGVPLRVVIGNRGLKEGNVEIKKRTDGESAYVKKTEAIQYLLNLLKGN